MSTQGNGGWESEIGDPDLLIQQQVVDRKINGGDIDPCRHRKAGLGIEINGEHRWPRSASAAATFRVLVVLAVPPF